MKWTKAQNSLPREGDIVLVDSIFEKHPYIGCLREIKGAFQSGVCWEDLNNDEHMIAKSDLWAKIEFEDRHAKK